MSNITNENIEKSIVNKIEEMESKDYEFPKRMQKNDYVIISVAILINFILLVVGYLTV